MRGFSSNQEAFTKAFLTKFGMTGDSIINTPRTFRTKPTLYLDKTVANITSYR